MPELTYRLKTESGLSDQLTSDQLAARIADGTLTSDADCTPDDGDTWFSVGACLSSGKVGTAKLTSGEDVAPQSSSETREPSSNDTVSAAPKRKLKKLSTARTKAVGSTDPGVAGIPKNLSVIVGQSLANGRYVVKSQFGAGSMAYVFRASDSRLETDVIVKVPKPEKITTEDYRERFHRESQLLVRLSHPHVVKVLDVGEFMRLPYVVMQLLSGGTLLDRILKPSNDQKRMAPESLKDWIREVSRALDFCYKRGMVHRDVKPANILFDDDNNAYVSDFGLTKIMHGEHTELCSSGTADGIVLGTPNYLPPEIILGGKYDGRADQYSLGLTVYHALCGQPPMQGKSATATMVNQTRKKLDLLSNVRPDVPRELALAIDKSIEKNPKNRFESCIEFAEAALEGLRTDSNSSRSTVLPAEPVPTSSQSSGRRVRANASNGSSRATQRPANSSASSRRSRSSSAKRKVAASPAAAVPAAQGAASSWLEPTMPPRRKAASKKSARRRKKTQAKQLIVFGRAMSLPIVATCITAAVLFPVVIAYSLWAGGDQPELSTVHFDEFPDTSGDAAADSVPPAQPLVKSDPQIDRKPSSGGQLPVPGIGTSRSYSSGIVQNDSGESPNRPNGPRELGPQKSQQPNGKKKTEDVPAGGKYSSGTPNAAVNEALRSGEALFDSNQILLGDAQEPLTVSEETVVVGTAVWDVRSQQQTVRLEGGYPVRAARAISQNGRYFAAATTELGRPSSGAQVWDTRNGKVVARLQGDPERRIDLILVGSEKVYFADRYSDELLVLKLNEPANGPSRLRLPDARFQEGSAAISSDGEFIAVPNSEALVVFRTQNGKTVGRMSLPKAISRISSRVDSLLGSLSGLSFSRTGDELAAVALAPTPRLLVWDAKGQLEVDHSLDEANDELAFHWLGRRSVFGLGKTLTDRDSNRVLLRSNGKIQSFGRTAAVVASEAGLVVRDIPWLKMADSLDAMKTDRAAPLHPSTPVSIIVSLGPLLDQNRILQASMREVIREQLDQNGLRVVENSTNRIVAHVTLERDQPTLRLEYYTATNLDPVWSEDIAAVADLLPAGVENRDRKHAELLERVKECPIPYYLPSNSKLASLPISLH